MDQPCIDRRFCEKCLEVRPIEEFRFRSRVNSTRHKDCNLCHNIYEQQRRVRQRSRRQRREIERFVLQTKKTISNRQIRILVGAMIAHFGGLEKLIQAWIEQWEAARTEKPGSKKACDGFLAVFRLMQARDAAPQTPDNYDFMTAEDIQHVMQQQTEQLLLANPEIAVRCARQLGWKVTPLAT